MAPSKSTLKDLSSTLDRVSLEFTRVAHVDDVFWQVQAIIDQNSEINKSDIFQDWIGTTYVDSITVRLRRVADRSSGTISLWRLLESMKPHAVQFTRSWFLSAREVPIPGLANSWFDRIAGEKASHVTKRRVNDKQKELTTAIAPISRYANAHVTHATETPGETTLTFSTWSRLPRATTAQAQKRRR